MSAAVNGPVSMHQRPGQPPLAVAVSVAATEFGAEPRKIKITQPERAMVRAPAPAPRSRREWHELAQPGTCFQPHRCYKAAFMAVSWADVPGSRTVSIR